MKLDLDPRPEEEERLMTPKLPSMWKETSGVFS